jgi:gliding motility-associated-like protein
VFVTVFPVPQFNIVEDRITGLTGSLVTIATTSSADITRWHWTPPVGLSCSNCPQPIVTIGTSITYTATVSNPGLCKTSDRVTIVPVCNQDNVYIPNTFSPNGDGQNDVFYPRGKGVSLVKSMRIFSRWGELLFEQKDFALNDPGAGWNGTYKGAVSGPDVYVYMIDVLCDNNILFNMKGNLTLLK